LNLKFEVGTIDEAIRLALVAFTHHVSVQWQHRKKTLVRPKSSEQDSLLLVWL